MAKNKRERINPPIKVGHGIHRAHKTEHKEHQKDFKHERKWLEQKMDNK
jgi:hypothetical protein